MDKEQQKKLLIEIMEADEKDGLYKTNNMEQQKLYTEEQVKLMIEKSRDTELTAEFLIIATPPIELPSDEEIKEYADRYSIMHEDVSDKLGKYLVSAIHIDGAKWMKEQILNQNK